MRLAFTANEVGITETDGDDLVCAIGNNNEHLVFWRAPKGAIDDRAVHVQYTDQSHRDRNCIRSYRLSKSILAVELSHQLGDLAGVDGFDIELAVDGEMIEALDLALRIMGL